MTARMWLGAALILVVLVIAAILWNERRLVEKAAEGRRQMLRNAIQAFKDMGFVVPEGNDDAD